VSNELNPEGVNMNHVSLSLGALWLLACSGLTNAEPAQQVAAGAQREAVPANDDPTFDAKAHNPFLGAQLAINPEYVKSVEASAALHPAQSGQIRKLEAYPTAIWIDSIEKAKSISGTLRAAASQATEQKPMLTAFVLYDLPNRDCAANASSGELSVADRGEARYRSEFIDVVAGQFAEFPTQRIVVVLEPDSLANLVTNLQMPRCTQAEAAYRDSISYAISKLSAPHVSIYLDAAHAGWTGWNGNRPKLAQLFGDVLKRAGGQEKIRGFATNVANYNTLSAAEGKRLGPTNPCPDELSYVTELGAALRRVGITNKQFIIDTSRNGRAVRKSWGHWCNIKGAGLGRRPEAAPAPGVDAYFWIKPPGESDGVSDPSQPRFDKACQSADSSSGAPQAGQWCDSYFLELVNNASPAL
jgi:cellulose 1,4-beta-cellobiosidase